MAFCKNCGAQIPDGSQTCPSCGTSAGASDLTASFDQQDINNNKGMAILAYLSWLVIVPLIAAPQSRFARFHANQGLILAISSTVWGILTGILAVIPVIGWIISMIMGLASLAFLVFMIMGIINAANGEAKELPLIGKFTIIK